MPLRVTETSLGTFTRFRPNKPSINSTASLAAPRSCIRMAPRRLIDNAGAPESGAPLYIHRYHRRPIMIVGSDYQRLDKRITKALLSKHPTAREAMFLQSMSECFMTYRESARLTDRQASWLFTILTRIEAAAKPSSLPKPRHPHLSPTRAARDLAPTGQPPLDRPPPSSSPSFSTNPGRNVTPPSSSPIETPSISTPASNRGPRDVSTIVRKSLERSRLRREARERQEDRFRKSLARSHGRY